MNMTTRSIQIFVGSMLGASEYVAEELQRVLTENGFTAEVFLQPNIQDTNKNATWILCSSTHGAGELPDNIQAFAKELASQTLEGVEYLVVALGDSSYDTFCEGGKTLYSILQKTGATPLSDVFCIDVLEHTIPEEVAAPWLENLIGEKILASS